MLGRDIQQHKAMKHFCKSKEAEVRYRGGFSEVLRVLWLMLPFGVQMS